jgi:hypothetical protein
MREEARPNHAGLLGCEEESVFYPLCSVKALRSVTRRDMMLDFKKMTLDSIGRSSDRGCREAVMRFMIEVQA